MISPQASIDPAANIHASVQVGPFSVIGPHVEIGAGTVVGPHVVIHGPTTIGQYCKILQFASLGEAPQDLSYQGEPTQLIIGDRNTIREHVTMNRGTVKGGGVTRVGSDNFIMAYAHIAHDCQVGNHNVLANAASLAGHVEIEDHVTLGGFTLVHQFCRIGAHAFTSMGCAVNRDVPPFTVAQGNYAKAVKINKTGLLRKGFSANAISGLQQAFKLLIHSRDREKGLAQVVGLEKEFPEVQQFVAFIRASQRGTIRT